MEAGAGCRDKVGEVKTLDSLKFIYNSKARLHWKHTTFVIQVFTGLNARVPCCTVADVYSISLFHLAVDTDIS